MRKKVTFKGYVQGVGFRYTVIMVSQGYNVTGYVKNMIDGSVEIVAEGEQNEINRFIEDVKECKTLNIRSVLENEEPETEEFSEFTIAF